MVTVIILIGLPSFHPEMATGHGSEEPQPETGDWIITNTTVVENRTIVLNGNLTIEPGGNLTLVNCTLLFNCSFDGQYGIEVRSGGQLHVFGRKEEGEKPEPQPGNEQVLFLYVGEQSGKLFAYKNNGTASEPKWESRGTVRDEGGEEIDVGTSSTPTFTDLDGDGDLDMVIGEGLQELNYYENTGTSEEPAWSGNNTMLSGVTADYKTNPTLADLDNDGDLDMILGDYSGYLFYYENTGSSEEPHWTEDDTLFSGIKVDHESAPALADLDNDGDLDLTIGRYDGRFDYHENTGSSEEPQWTKDDSQFSGIDVGVYSKPAFADLDGDGDYDLTSGEMGGELFCYENTGTKENSQWTSDSAMYAGIDVGSASAPALLTISTGKIQDSDVVVGAYDGRLYHWHNTGTGSELEWESRGTLRDSGGSEIKVGYYSAPTLADLDGDGDNDLTCGEYYGAMYYYENTGTAAEPEWTRDTSMYAGIDVGTHNKPVFTDLDGDGDLDLAVGEYSGALYYYENTGTASRPEWTEDSAMFAGIDVGYYSAPAFADLDGDRDFDLTIGEWSGTLFYYKNTGTAAHPLWTGDNTMFSGIDVGSNSAPAFADLDDNGNLDLTIGESQGTLYYYSNTGTASQPEWTRDDTMFSGIDAGSTSAPAFTTIVGDGQGGGGKRTQERKGVLLGEGEGGEEGDYDLVIGEYYGNLFYYENTGNRNESEWTRDSAMFWGQDFGSRAAPDFADLDLDGDFDLLIGRYESGGSGTLVFMENTGTSNEPQWTSRGNIRDSDGEVISVTYYSAPSLADLDDDGDFDLTIGAYDGSIHYYQNTGSSAEPVWTEDASMYLTVTSQTYNVPTHVDIDADGDLDLVLGENEGKLKFYENTGTPSLAVWFYRGYLKDSNGQDIQAEGSSTYKWSAPAFRDLDNDGDEDLVVGGYSGTVKHYENTGTPSSFEWTYLGLLKDKNGVDIDVGYASIPTFVDLGEGEEEPEEPKETVWYTRIASTGDHHFDFMVLEGGVLELKDTWITNCGNGTQGHRGLTIDAADARITGNLFDNNSMALYLDGGDGSSISYNTFVNNSIGILARDCSGLMILNNSFSDQHSGIHLVDCSNTLITLNDVRRTGTGVILESCSDINVEENTVTDSALGVHVAGGEKNTIHGNNITGCGEGVVLRDSRENTVTDNNLAGGGVLLHGTSRAALASHFFSNNMINQQPLYYYVDARDDAVPPDAGAVIMVNCTNMTMENLDLSYTTAGLQLFWVNDSLITDSTFSDSLMGIRLTGSCGNVIQQNIIMNNIVGLVVQNGSVGNSIRFNTVKENEEAGLDASGNSGLPVDAVSNYWGGYNGPHNASVNPGGDGDSIAGNVGFRPWLRFPPGENVWYVDATVPSGGDGRPGEPFARIQDALDNASRGETIIVLPGTYKEQLTVNRAVEIQGRFGEVILDAEGGTGIRIEARTTITNFTFTNATSDLELGEDTIVYNTSFSGVDFLKDCSLSVGHYLTVLALDGNGEPLPGAEVIIANNASEAFTFQSGAEGLIRNIPLIEYIMNPTGTTRLDPFYLTATYGARYDNASLYLHANTLVTLNLSMHGAFGTGAASGDLDGDGVDDHAVGAPLDCQGGWNSGAVFIFSGSASLGKKELMAEDADIIITGGSAWDRFGTSVIIDDINRDGKNDLVVTAPGDGGEDGAVYLFPGELFEAGNVGIEDSIPLAHQEPDLGKTLITADIDGDGYPDILTENAEGVKVFYGKPGNMADLSYSTFYGLNSPVVVTIAGEETLAAVYDGDVKLFSLNPEEYLLLDLAGKEDFQGSFNHTRFDNGITISPYVAILPNGDFDEGWDTWSRVGNIRGKNDGQWELTTEEHGDWMVYDGATAGLGPVGYDYVATANNAGRYSNGKLVSEPFLVPADIRYFDFWHHVKWWSYERANEGNQDDIPDAVILRLVNESSGEVVCEKVYNQTEYNYDGEFQGRLQFDISDYQGEWLRFEVEHVTNYKEYDDGLIQIDSIYGSKENPDLEGNFTSDFLDFNMSMVYFIPCWEEELNGGNITLQYRTNGTQDWLQMIHDEAAVINASSFQYRVVIEGVQGEPFPVLEELHFNFYGFMPVSLGTGTPHDGGGIFGNSTLAIVDDMTAVIYNGTSVAFSITSEERIDDIASIGDVDGNGVSDLLISANDTVYLIPMNGTSGDLELHEAPYSFTGKEGFGLFLHRNLVGSPLEHRRDGRVYLLPTHLNDTAIIGINIENHSLVYPDSMILINLSLVNMGLHDMDALDVTMNITAENGYTFENSTRISIGSWENALVGFAWHVPGTEGTNYTVRFLLPQDHDNSNNGFSVDIRAHYHDVALSTSKAYDTVRPGGILHFILEVENRGTFGPDNVSFETSVPGNWSWWTMKDGTNITNLMVDGKETIDLFVFGNASIGEYPVIFSVTSENGWTRASGDLTCHLVDRDLVPVGVRFFRDDGREAEPVAGENTTIVLEIMNHGLQSAGSFDITLEVDGSPTTKTAGGVGGNTSVTITFTLQFTGGDHTIGFILDVGDAVMEYNENNNFLMMSVNVRPETASTPFVFTVRVRDLGGGDVDDASVSARSGAFVITNITDSHGMTNLTLVDSYREGSIYRLEAVKGELYGVAEVRVYSEDAVAEITIVVGRYSLTLNCLDRDKDIMPDGNQHFIINLKNTGDFDDSFRITIHGLPGKWNSVITGSGLENGTIFLEKGKSTAIDLNLTAWRYAPAYERSEIVVRVSSLVATHSEREVLIRVSTLAVENITISTDDLMKAGSPGGLINYRITLKNEGNTIRSIALMVSGDVEYSDLNMNTLTLSPGGSTFAWLSVDVPNLREGTVLHHVVYGVVSGVGPTPALYFSTTIETYSKSDRIKVSIGDHTFRIQNNGNTFENLSLYPRMECQGIECGEFILDLHTFELDMGKEIEVPFEIRMMDMGIPSGSTIDADVAAYNGKIWFNSTLPLTVPPVYNLSLTPESTHLRAASGTCAEFRILVKNTGNTRERIVFSRTTTGDEAVIVPPPLTLERNKEEYITLQVPIPDHAEGTRKITLTGIAGDIEVTIDLLLNISALRSLALSEISVKPYQGGAKYSIRLLNNGETDEGVELAANCGELDVCRVEVKAGGSIQLYLMVPPGSICPEQILINAVSTIAGDVRATLTLVPPPIAVIQVLNTLPITIDNPVELRAVGNYSSYQWHIQTFIVNAKEITYPFSRSGNYSVTLTVTDSRKLTAVSDMTITVENRPPRIVLPIHLSGKIGEFIELDAGNSHDEDGDIAEYSWVIDTSTYYGMRIYHVFEKEGIYPVTLTLADNLGASNSTTLSVTITSPTTSSTGSGKKEEFDHTAFTLSLMLIFVVVGLFILLYFRMEQKETSLLYKLDEMKKMKTLGGKEIPSESEKKVHEGIEGEARICATCEAKIPRYFRFCNKCGSTLKEEDNKPTEEGKSKACPECGALVPGYYKFCNICGVTMGKTEVEQ